MSRTLFLNRFSRGLPRTLAYILLALIILALLDYFKGSIVPDAGAALPANATLRGLSPGVEGPWIESPRECDLPAGISSDCVFMD